MPVTAPSRTPATDPLGRRLLLATPVGWALGIVAGVVLIVIAESFGVGELQTPLVVGVALGVSTQQYRALRSVLAGARLRWTTLSCIGLAIPFAVADVAAASGHAISYDLVTFVIIGGILVSLLQWSVLRSRVGRANGWLLASPVGYLAAASTVWLNDRVLPQTPGIPGALQYLGVILAGGVLLGAVTAWTAARFEYVATDPDRPAQ